MRQEYLVVHPFAGITRTGSMGLISARYIKAPHCLNYELQIMNDE